MITRENWLNEAVVALKEKYFTSRGYGFPENVMVSCGFPFKNSKAIGQCFPKESSEGEVVQLFISPKVSDPIRVLDILLHEMIHAHLGAGMGHGKEFRKLFKEFGFEGKVTASIAAPETLLHDELSVIAEELGEYPHTAIKEMKEKPKKPSRKIRLYSVTDPSYSVVIRKTTLAEFGPPNDYARRKMVTKEELEGAVV